MLRFVALGLLFAGAAFAIGAYNPFFGEPNLHPTAWVVITGAVACSAGAALLGFVVTPRKPNVRPACLVVVVAMALLAVTSVVF